MALSVISWIVCCDGNSKNFKMSVRAKSIGRRFLEKRFDGVTLCKAPLMRMDQNQATSYTATCSHRTGSSGRLESSKEQSGSHRFAFLQKAELASYARVTILGNVLAAGTIRVAIRYFTIRQPQTAKRKGVSLRDRREPLERSSGFTLDRRGTGRA